MADWEVAAEQVRADIAEDVRLAVDAAAKASRVRVEVEQTVGQAEVDGVRAQADASGRILGLEVDEAVCRRGGKAVAQAVFLAAGRAHRDAVGKVAKIAAREFGEDSAYTSRIRTEAEARLLVPAEPEPPASPIIGRPVPIKDREARWRTW